MAVDPLLDKNPIWLTDATPEAGIAVLCQCSLARNLSDFPFPARCSEDERGAVEARITDILDNLNLLSTGEYYSLPALHPNEIQFLAERRLITYDLMCTSAQCGVYVAEDQSLSIMVNGADHLCMRVMQSGLQLQEAWARLNLIDDTLGGMLDFAFDARLGYLTADLRNVGTGLKASVLLHLPGLTLTDRLSEQGERVSSEDLVLRGVKAGAGDAETVACPTLCQQGADQSIYSDMDGALNCPVGEGAGDLCLLVNESTLGLSEEELVFHVHHAAEAIIAEEKAARHVLLRDSYQGLQDKIGRAQGVAAGARLMEFTEGVQVLSSLRLGVETGVVRDYTVAQMNALLFKSQGAHLGIACGQEGDPLTLNRERADLFRRVFMG